MEWKTNENSTPLKRRKIYLTGFSHSNFVGRLLYSILLAQWQPSEGGESRPKCHALKTEIFACKQSFTEIERFKYSNSNTETFERSKCGLVRKSKHTHFFDSLKKTVTFFKIRQDCGSAMQEQNCRLFLRIVNKFLSATFFLF